MNLATLDWTTEIESLRQAAIRLPLATVLSTTLAFRPRRRGTPHRQAGVIQTQIILAVVGAIVMLVVGSNLARAFGIVGAAGLIRYRSKIEDPKDAGVMLSTLALGLACGVGLYMLAVFSTVFVMGLLWLVESIEPEPYSVFTLTIGAKGGVNELKPSIEHTLRRYRIPFEIRNTTADDLGYEVKVPIRRNTETVTDAIAALDLKQPIEVKWEKQKEK